MTTNEAAEKWCPLMKNRDEINVCISSNCMMWRWKTSLKEQGHCGLAGKPVEE